MQDENPYQAPTAADIDPPPATQTGLEPASRGRRLGTLVVDTLLTIVVIIPFLYLTETITGTDLSKSDSLLASAAVNLLPGFLYYLVFESLWARTPGKRAFGTVVVGDDGRPPSFRQVLIRTTCRWIPFEPISVLLSDPPIGWHDSIAHTRVVRWRSPH